MEWLKNLAEDGKQGGKSMDASTSKRQMSINYIIYANVLMFTVWPLCDCVQIERYAYFENKLVLCVLLFNDDMCTLILYTAKNYK